MKENILYIMHIDWNWIKQRPQFIAEGLSKHFNMYICCPITRNKKTLAKNERVNGKYIKYIKNPFRRYSKALYFLNNIILKLYFNIIIVITKPKYIYITFPEMIEYIPVEFKGSIIYDCMDDSIELQKNSKFKELLHFSEKKLVDRADIILCSSNYLISKLEERYKTNKNKVTLIHNAYSGAILKCDIDREVKQKARYKICYIGTVSSWFNYELLTKSIEKFPSIEYHIIGPVEIKYDENSAIKFYGTVNHEDLFQIVKDFDCFIMPFKINELVKAVNPVKLYEYLNFNKPIISVYYDEVELFKDVVYFYNDEQEYYLLLNNLIDKLFPRKYSDNKRIEFLKKNSWDSRLNKITTTMQNFRKDGV